VAGAVGAGATLSRSVWGRCSYLALGGAVIAVLAAGGCGGGSSTVTSSGASGASGATGASGASRVSKAAFIKQADQICAEANTAIDSLSAGTSTDQSFQVSQELDITRSELQSLQALTPPQGNKSTLNDFLTAVKNEVDALTRANTAVQGGGDTSTADAELASAKQNAEAAATRYGMKDCGNAKSHHQAGASTTAVPTTTTPVPTTTPTTTTPVTPTTTTPAPAPAPVPPTGGTGGSSGGTGGSAGGTGGSGGGNGGTGGSGGVTP
jgi:hypothetical protein